MLALTVREGDYITIGDDIVVKTGELFRLAIDAPRSLDIRRGKVHEARTGSVPAAIQKLRNKTERS